MNPDYPLHSSPRDWPEDSAHENGNYLNSCCGCKLTFIGHKRRVVCHVCHDIEQTRQAKLTPEERMREGQAFIEAAREFFAKTLDKPAQG